MTTNGSPHVDTQQRPRQSWREALDENAPLLLPVAHDALTAKVIEQAGYPAYQIGGFAVVGSRFGYPDIDLAQFGENSAVMRDTIAACSLPVLVDADDANGDVKNVTRVVQGYEAMGASAIFLEDQKAPKRCGHMIGKTVIPAEEHAGKLRAAAAARLNPDTFIMARTDALAPLGLDEALRRAELYLKSGADGVYIEAVQTVEQLEKVGKTLSGAPLATSILEGGGRTPWMAPKDLHGLGYTMLLYPTTVIFRVTRAIQKAVEDLRAGRPMPAEEAVTFSEYETLLGLPQWAELEDQFGGGHDPLSVPHQKAA